MSDTTRDKKNLIIFYAITLSASLMVELIRIFASGSDLWMILLMWIPGITGLVCAKKMYPGESIIGFRKKFKSIYGILALMIPILYLVSSYMISWAIFLRPMSTSAKIPYFAGEQGIITIAFAALIVLVMILKQNKSAVR